jgi:hypothetical protein
MRTTRNISAIAVLLSAVFISAAPVLAAGASPAPNTGAATMTDGKPTGTAEVQDIQQSLDSAEASMTTSTLTTGTGNRNGSAQVQAPVADNPGTLAESAKTTALSTPTYQQ